MFEGKPPIAPIANGSEYGETVAGELCPIDWSDLTARLAAARDLRRELAVKENSARASFDALHARSAGDGLGQSSGENKQPVNPDDLANGKGLQRNTGLHVEHGGPANRGNT